MLAPSLRKVTHLTPMRCASATKRSTTSLGWLVVGTQCMPRPLSPFGWGYALSARGSDGSLACVAVAASGFPSGVVGLDGAVLVGVLGLLSEVELVVLSEVDVCG